MCNIAVLKALILANGQPNKDEEYSVSKSPDGIQIRDKVPNKKIVKKLAILVVVILVSMSGFITRELIQHEYLLLKNNNMTSNAISESKQN